VFGFNINCIDIYTPTAFWGAAAFNADISKWDTAAVTIIAGSTSKISTSSSSVHCLLHCIGSLTIFCFLFSLLGQHQLH
jgi:hypothetical protein